MLLRVALLRLIRVGAHRFVALLRKTWFAALDLCVYLAAVDLHVRWRLNAKPHLLADDGEDGNLDVVADHDALVGLARQYEHFDCSLQDRARHRRHRGRGTAAKHSPNMSGARVGVPLADEQDMRLAAKCGMR